MSPLLRTCASVLIIQALTAAAAQAKPSSRLVRKADEKQTNQLEDPQSVTNAQTLLQEVEDLARSGERAPPERVKAIKSIVTDELIPDLEALHLTAVGQVRTNLDSIDLCNSQAVSRNNDIKASTEVSVGSARSDHSTCRADEKTKHGTSNSRCGQLDTFLDTINDPANLPTARPRDGMVQYVETMSNYFCPKGPEVTTLDAACKQAEAEQASHKAECDRKQAAFESGFCTWRTELVDTCDSLSQCYAHDRKGYNDHVTQTTALVTKWKVEFSALKKILCYMDVWLSDNDVTTADAGAYETCNSATPDTSPMDVDFGTPATEVVCSLTSVVNHPGTSGFVTTEYSDVNDYVSQVIPCIGLPAPAPSFVEISAVGKVKPSGRHATRKTALQVQSVEADGTVQ